MVGVVTFERLHCGTAHIGLILIVLLLVLFEVSLALFGLVDRALDVHVYHVLILLESLPEEARVLDFEVRVLEHPLPLVYFLEVPSVCHHVHFESFLPAGLEVDELDNVIWNVAEVQQNDDHVTLFESNSFAIVRKFIRVIRISLVFPLIFNQFFSFIDMRSDVTELECIARIRNDLIPRIALHRFERHLDLRKTHDSVWIRHFYAKSFLKVRILSNELVCTSHFY